MAQRRCIGACTYDGNPGSPGNARTGGNGEIDSVRKVPQKRREAVRLQADSAREERNPLNCEIRKKRGNFQGNLPEQQPESSGS